MGSRVDWRSLTQRLVEAEPASAGEVPLYVLSVPSKGLAVGGWAISASMGFFLDELRNYGSLFLGRHATVVYGDKAVGTNHVLPTNRAARFTGGLWVGKFLKTVTYQKLTTEASQRIAPVMGRMCAAEGMMAHERTATVRVERYAQRRR